MPSTKSVTAKNLGTGNLYLTFDKVCKMHSLKKKKKKKEMIQHWFQSLLGKDMKTCLVSVIVYQREFTPASQEPSLIIRSWHVSLLIMSHLG